jgi:hypothetical protein
MKPEEFKMILDHNLNLCTWVINKAERVNKGRYTHDINVLLHKIKDGMKKKPKDMKELTELCRYRTVLSEYLYLLEHNK